MHLSKENVKKKFNVKKERKKIPKFYKPLLTSGNC